MAVDSYANLSTTINTWSVRGYSQTQIDEFLVLAESAFNRKLGSNYRRKVTATITTDASGEATLPSGVISVVSLVRAVVGSLPLTQVSWNALIQRNPYQISDDASAFAIKGAALKVAPVTEDDFTAVYWAKLTGLSGSNASNWLLDLAPDAYLFMLRSVQSAFEEDEQRAVTYKALSEEILDELISQSNVAEYGNAEMTLPMVTP